MKYSNLFVNNGLNPKFSQSGLDVLRANSCFRFFEKNVEKGTNVRFLVAC